ncbi:hypothetical protein L6V77_07220 [Myxococcota bacterium]|nr:hypothetical protein [Myxococcota bacterium]
MSERERERKSDSEGLVNREAASVARSGRVFEAAGFPMLVGAALVLGLSACGSSSDDGGGGDAAAGGSTGGTPILDDMGTDASGGTAGGAGGEQPGGAGGEGGSGGGSTEQPPDVRCPDLQAGEYLLIAFPDRVDAYRQRDFGASYFCTFLDLRAAGITNAGGFARSAREDGPFYVTATNDGRGEIHAYDADGNYIERVAVNINLADIDGLWSHPSGDAFVAWSKGNSNFYELDGEGGFRGPWLPPLSMTSRVEGVTDLLFLDAESAIATFTNRPPKLYKHPFAPDFPADQIGAANAIAGIATEEGTKLLITGEAGGAGNGFGVMLYKAAASGRVPPELEAVLVQPGEFTDGVGLLSLGSGFLLLDSAIAGSAKLVTFNADGMLQEEIGLEGGGNPFAMFFAQIFPNY